MVSGCGVRVAIMTICAGLIRGTCLPEWWTRKVSSLLQIRWNAETEAPPTQLVDLGFWKIYKNLRLSGLPPLTFTDVF